MPSMEGQASMKRRDRGTRKQERGSGRHSPSFLFPGSSTQPPLEASPYLISKISTRSPVKIGTISRFRFVSTPMSAGEGTLVTTFVALPPS
jgi:hypothetical protein